MRAFVVGVQAGIDPFLHHLRPESSRRRFGDTTFEEQLNLVRASYVQIVANDGFEPLAALG